MRRPLVLIGIVVAIFAGAYLVASHQNPSSIQSGISGKVFVGPTCPVQRVGDPSCDDKPYQGAFTVKNTTGVQVAQFSTDNSGNFRVLLAPGSYAIAPVNRIGISQQSQTVLVPPGQVVYVVLTFDTGIR